MNFKKQQILLCAVLLLSSLGSIQGEELPLQVQAELLAAMEAWNDFFGYNVQALAWEYEGRIDTEAERQQIVSEMTQPENAWFPDGDLSKPEEMAAKQLSYYQGVVDGAKIAQWKGLIDSIVQVGHHVVRISWGKSTSQFSTLCIADDETLVYDSMIFNVALVEEHSRCLDIRLLWLWGRTRGRITADLTAVCDGPIARDCCHHCGGWCKLGTAKCNCKVTMLSDHCHMEYSWAWAVGLRSVEVQADNFTLKVTGHIGSAGEGDGSCNDFCAVNYVYDPPIWKNIVAYPAPEHIHHLDFNGDNDLIDTILCYRNIETHEVVNTTLALFPGSRVDIFRSIIVFVGEDSRIRYYDIATNAVKEIGVTGAHPSIYEDTIAFVSENTICYFDFNTDSIVDTKARGDSPFVYRGLIVFHSVPTSTICIYDMRTRTAVDTGISGMNPTLCGDIVAFETSESQVLEDLNGDGDKNDMIIRYYDIETKTLVNTGAVGVFPTSDGNKIVFSTQEESVEEDLNKDGKILGNVIRYYDLETGQTVNTMKMGTKPDIYENVVSFSLWEYWTGQDLNNDGDMNDLVMDIYRIGATEVPMESLGTAVIFAILTTAAIAILLRRKR